MRLRVYSFCLWYNLGPMDKPKITPKDFFLWFGAMAALYTSVFAFIALLFSYLNYAFPDPLAYYSSDPYSGGISYQMASLIVLYPIFLLLIRLIRRSIETDPTRAHIWIRRWALYLTLFIAGVTVVGDLITLIMYFFNGDVTIRFALKVLVIFVVVGATFLHFLADLRGYWERNSGKARTIGFAVGALILVSIVAGFFIVGTPWQARLYRYDEQKVSDLQNIQYQVVYYWQAKQELPSSPDDLADSIAGYTAPSDPQTGEPYEYVVTGIRAFELCATFNAESQRDSVSFRTEAIAPSAYPAKGETDNWQHGEGRICFARTIDPERYPPLSR